ncbi:hypothetical protein NYV26_05250 [Escherichia coli]|uniref:hypothetical protein n=1 Tax=Escherichia coli TaxID=562 RepID=UPI002235975E|nr:hypothetical protein [Escherichia coli]MCW6948388.1 hypothetical protein [Escherichia coli]
MIWQPEFTDKTLSRKPGAVQFACKQGLVNGELVRLFAPWSGIPRLLHALFAGRKGMPAIARYFMDELTTRLANGV